MELMQLKEAYEQAMQCNGYGDVYTDTEYGVYEDDEVFRVAFKGSTSIIDWKQNFSFWKIPYKDMKHLFFVHAGFDKKYRSIRDGIMLSAKLAHSKGKRIEGRGYSQGAAVAERFHEDVYYNITKSIQSVVFGKPRGFSWWGFWILRKRFSELTRVVNGGDIVTGLPMWILGYKHYGKKEHIGKKKLFKLSVKDHITYKEQL